MSYVVTFAFIILDFITGLVMALTTGTFSSGVMREGLYKKLSLVLCMGLGYLVDYAQVYIDLGVAIPVATSVCAYICVMEIGSVLENICEINPDIMPERLTTLFGIVVSTGSTDEQTTTATVSEAVTAIMESIRAAMQTTAEQNDDQTATETIGAAEVETLNDAMGVVSPSAHFTADDEDASASAVTTGFTTETTTDEEG